MDPKLIAECCAEMRASLAELAKLPAGISATVESQIENAALALVELCAVDADTEIGWDTNRRIARLVAGIRPDQAADLSNAVTDVIGEVTDDAARQSGRNPMDLIEPVSAVVLERLHQINPTAFEWVVAALTVDPA